MKYYIYPDGTISEEPLEFMSDDYYVLETQDYEEAYEMALILCRLRNAPITEPPKLYVSKINLFAARIRSGLR